MRYRTWNLDIDRFLLPLVPSPPWHLLPYPVAHFLGHRKTTPRETGNLMPIFWAFVGILCSLLVIEAVTIRVPLFEARAVPMIVGSFGAAAVLEFYAIESPLAQPRNAIVGQAIATVAGVARRFPMYWWTPLDLPHKDPAFVSDAKGEAPKPQHQQRWRLRRRAGDDEEAGVVDEEKTVVGGSSSQQTGESDGDGDGATAPKQGQRTVAHGRHAQAQVVIRRGQVIVPEHLILTQDEVQLLESMSHRIS
ncbi:HPP family protein [Ophiocordyceps sinensis CO18]|uniref:HPP family protein n=1 Tax=Ophiocordyceps sinensis (strain Co18 / CGMCC 3.14243) TaxID=911162 RepID=T5A9D6_OPHSC|nr:HPP family protein [Ophiocordyceps sinensis CO18]